MKHFSTLIIITAIALIMSACGAPPAPTMSAADIGATAQAAASTMIAQTLAAVPTNTPLPPTSTFTPVPSPTNTLEVSPTVFAALPSPTQVKANVDPCSTRVLGKPKGKPTIIRIWNDTKTPIQVSMYLNETEGHGECGYRSYTLAKNADVLIRDLVYGCYNLWAWNTSGKPNFNSSGYGCINNPDKWTFEVRTSAIKFTGP